jgi:prolyl 4-hydroxylase
MSKSIDHVAGRIIEVEDVMSVKECDMFIQHTEKHGYKQSPPSGGGHGQTSRTGARTSQFYVEENEELASTLWNTVNKFVPKNLHNIKQTPYMSSSRKGDEYSAVGVSPHMRFYKYNKGQYILKHDDYRMSRIRYDKKNEKYYKQMTFLTLLIYLNDGFQGGHTVFWSKYATPGGPSSHCRFLRDVEFQDGDINVAPRKGCALINDHVVQHEGRVVTKGTKYILRTDIIHEKEIRKEMVFEKIKKNEEYSSWSKHYEPSCLNYTE